MSASAAARGFVLQSSYRIEHGRPVVLLYGRLESGASFALRDTRQVPHFYIQRTHAQSLPQPAGTRLRESAKQTFAGEAVARVEVATPPDAPGARDLLIQSGAATYEADVRFALRYLIDRNLRGGVEILGPAQRGQGTDWLYVNPEVRPIVDSVTPRVLSFDIETNPRTDRLLAIALYGCGIDEVVVVDGSDRAMPERAIRAANERAALSYFCRRVAELDVDVLTGWNVIDFDLSFLHKVAERVRLPLQLGRDTARLRIQPAEGYFGSGRATISGRLVLDGLDLLRGAFVRVDDYSLDAVAREVLGEGKALAGDVKDRVGEILHNYRHDLAAFALYARTDARLVVDILQRLDLVALAFARSRLTGMPPDRVAASIASFDFLYLAALHRRGVVAPSVASSDSRVHAAQAGGQVFEPTVGVHENVWVFDFKSLYPSIIRTYGIDPLAYVDPALPPDESRTRITLADGTQFYRPSDTEPSILPAMLDELFPQRATAKAEGNGVAAQAIKILMNSFYGVLGTPACRFYNPALANAITAQGRYLLNWLKEWFERQGYEVLYGDTDSVFVRSSLDSAAASTRAVELVGKINQQLAVEVEQSHGVQSRLELEFEKLYLKLFLPSVRGGSGGARKRYAGLRAGAEALEFVGMEVVRRDWTDLAKDVQRSLYARLFRAEPVEQYLYDVVARLRAGELDEQLVYRKGLRKSVASYTANTPPHVVAARKSKSPHGRVIAYCMTTAGPEPIDHLTAPLDYEHYVAKQIKPVAEPVLAAMDLDFARVIGDDRQLGLF